MPSGGGGWEGWNWVEDASLPPLEEEIEALPDGTQPRSRKIEVQPKRGYGERNGEVRRRE